MKHKILIRMLGITLSVMMVFTSIPVNMAAFAGDVGGSGGGGDITTEFDPYKQLKVVKCYGMVNPVTYEVEDEKETVVWEQKTRNVHITPEAGYRLAEYVYSTRGSSDWNSMTASKWGTVQGTDTDKDKQFYIKGFIDGEKRTILYYKKRKG